MFKKVLKQFLLLLSMAFSFDALSAKVSEADIVLLRNVPSPAVWHNEGKWYVASSANEMLHSEDLKSWKSMGVWMLDMHTYNGIQSMGFGQVITPFVVRIKGRLLMYATMYKNHKECAIGVFSALRPQGPFGNGSVLTTPDDCKVLDLVSPFVTEDPSTGKVWMFFGATSRINVIELAPDGLSIAEGANAKAIAGLPIQDSSSGIVKARAGLSIQGSGERFRVFMEPYVIKRGEWWYLFASRGKPDNENYALIVGRSKNVTGPYFDKFGRQMLAGWSSSLLQSWPGDKIYAPGNCAGIFRHGTDDYMIFNAILKNRPPMSEEEKSNVMLNVISPQCLLMKKIKWTNEGWPFF